MKPIPGPAGKSARASHITPRAVILAIILAVLNDYWLVQLEVVRYSFATYAAPFYNVVFTLFVVTCVNLLVRRLFPRFALSGAELLTVYVMLSITSAVCSTHMLQILVSLMGYAFHLKPLDNTWDTLFLKDVPRWLTVSDKTALENYYQGGSSLYLAQNFRPWLGPVLCWSAFGAVLVLTTIFLSSILRKHWTESERLTFPIIQLPLEMTSEDGALFKNKIMWAGFIIAGGITLLAGIHHLYPSVPAIRIVRQGINQYFVTPPWNSIGTTWVGFYFFAIGLAFIMPLDLSFSCWIFFILLKLEFVLCSSMGWNQLRVQGGGFDRGYPFPYSQAFGAYSAMVVMIIWNARKYFGSVLRTAFTKNKEIDDSREPISYRTAVIGVMVGVIFLGGFAMRMGMSFPVVAAFFLIYFALAIVVARIRAELGFPVHDMPGMGPQNALIAIAGTKPLGTQNLIGFALFHWFNRTYASHPMPHELEGYKVAERTKTPARQMFVAMCIAAVVAMPIGFWMLLHIYYNLGGATAKMEYWALGMGGEAWGTLADRLNNAVPTNTTALIFVMLSFCASLAMGWLRRLFPWFPLHPLAFAAASSWGVAMLWVPLMIGSIAKFTTLRYSGLNGYRKVLPFFLGLILGEIVIGSLWTLIGIAFGIPTYDFWPGKAN
ncbi:MAG: hypothetical protein Q7N50_13260 [Armatimonadota bacterium]|nr:hypothetical protein [Armatimonadota bacterium]